VLVPVPCALLPIVAGHLAELERRGEWATEEEWEMAYPAILEIEVAMLTCGQSIAESLERLNKALGFKAGLAEEDPNYDPADTLKITIDQVETLLAGLAEAMGYIVTSPPEPPYTP
jgi:hypothetical protein